MPRSGALQGLSSMSLSGTCNRDMSCGISCSVRRDMSCDAISCNMLLRGRSSRNWVVLAGPTGGDCSVADLTLQSDIVAQSGFWAPPDSDGSVFYKCPVAAACLPGVNGTRSECATGYGSIVCRYRTLHKRTTLIFAFFGFRRPRS